MRRAGEAERRRLAELFGELCAIPSPFGGEQACFERVARELDELGIPWEHDGTGPALGSDAPGNLLARLPAASGALDGGVLFCAHLDTVPHHGAIVPAVQDGRWVDTAGGGILGADNKAAVAVLLAAAWRWAAAPPPVPVELLFTLVEEDALRGAKAFDVGRLRSRFGYVFDHASPIGEIVMASPTYYRLLADFQGRSAHAGIRPEDGRSAIRGAALALAAMPLGRLDARTTTNAGTIAGGTGVNVVPERCRVELEARSLDAERAHALAGELVGHLHDGANAAECDVDVTVTKMFAGFRHRTSAPQVECARTALAACGYVPREIVTGGGSDANALEAGGFPCTNLANGTERNHQPDEAVSVADLEGMLEVAHALLEAAAGLPAAEG